jgi:branched-chain amino acid transport system substrate-binding protein
MESNPLPVPGLSERQYCNSSVPALTLPHPTRTVISRRTAALVGAALSCVACSRPSGPIEIGLAGPLSQPRGIAMQHGAQLAVDQINAQGGVGGRRLLLRLADDSASEDAAVRVAQTLYDKPAVMAVVGHLTSDASIVAAQVYGGGTHPVTMISPSASSPDLSGISPYAFRICPSDSSHGAALARFAWQTLVARRAGILFISDAYGRGVRKTFAADFARLGGTVVEADPYVPTTRSLEPYLSRMRQAGIDVLLLAADRGGAELALRQVRALGIHWPVIGGDALAGIETAGTVAEGIWISSAYLPDRAGEKNAAFVADYARAHPGERPDHRGASAYDIINLLAQAITVAGPSRRAVRDYVARVGRGVPAFDGVTGRIAFDDAGEAPSKGVVIAIVRGGRLVAEPGE